MVEEEFGELSFLLGEPQVRTVIIQYSTNGNNIKIILYYLEKIPKNDAGVLRTESKETQHRVEQ